jgi:hypothetical protein
MYSCGPKRFEHAETRRLVACLTLCICTAGRKICVTLKFLDFSVPQVLLT